MIKKKRNNFKKKAICEIKSLNSATMMALDQVEKKLLNPHTEEVSDLKVINDLMSSVHNDSFEQL